MCFLKDDTGTFSIVLIVLSYVEENPEKPLSIIKATRIIRDIRKFKHRLICLSYQKCFN